MATLNRGHELQNMLSTEYRFFFNLKYLFCPPTLLLFDSPARGGHNSCTTATDLVLTNSFFLFSMFLMWTYLIYAVVFAVKLFILLHCVS